MKERYIVGLDQSTQGTKAVLTDSTGQIVEKVFLPHEQIISPEGWVSHDGEEIFRNCVHVIRMLIEKAAANKRDVIAIGISNQRETTIAWDRKTGRPVEKAIVWQCARAKGITAQFEGTPFERSVRAKTGIPLSPYFPAAKAAWILQNVSAAKDLAENGRLCIGTIDSWLIYKLTDGKAFKTDYSNASRTQLFNLHTLQWDEEICRTLGIPISALAEVNPSDANFGSTTLAGFFDTPVPISAALGDSHAALFGQGCVQPGMAKATYGTGSSVMMNIGSKFRESGSGLVTSLAWGQNGHVEYVLEGNINYSGAVITWLQKDLGLIQNAGESGTLAGAANPADRTYLVPAFSGLGAPYWSNDAKAVFCGMSRTTGRRELVKAGVEAIAYQVTDIIEAMGLDSGLQMTELRVDGGPTENKYLMQFQSDMAQVKICVPRQQELSALGAAYMAGIACGLLKRDILSADRTKETYRPKMKRPERQRKYDGWKAAVKKAL